MRPRPQGPIDVEGLRPTRNSKTLWPSSLWLSWPSLATTAWATTKRIRTIFVMGFLGFLSIVSKCHQNAYLNPKSRQNKSPKPIIIAIGHHFTYFGVQVLGILHKASVSMRAEMAEMNVANFLTDVEVSPLR